MKNYFYWSLRQLYLFAFLPTQFEHEVETPLSNKPKLRYSDRLRYLSKLLPSILAFNVLGNLIAGYVCWVYHIDFEWSASWLGVILGMMGGAAFGTIGGIPRALGGGLGGWALGVALGLAGGLSVGLASITIAGTVAGILAGVLFRRIFGQVSGVRLAIVTAISVAIALAVAGTTWVLYWYKVAGGLSLGANRGSAVGFTLGLAFGIAGGIASGLAYGTTFTLGSSLAFGTGGSIAFGLAFGIVLSLIAGRTIGFAAGEAFALSFLPVFCITYFRLLNYPLDVILSTVSYGVARSWPHRVGEAWRWCPVSWNEVIWLPIPFASNLLALFVQQDRQGGLRQIAFVAAERRLQRRVSLSALVDVAVDDLQVGSLEGLSDVTVRLDWTTDAPGELPDELVTALPRFDRTAHHVAQYFTLNSPYLKGEALERAVATTESLQLTLVAARGRYAPRLLQVANQWRAWLDVESKKAKASAVPEIPNPFGFGNPVDETEHNVFTGRRDIVRQIEGSMLGAMRTPTLLLYGPRRMGKTSILNQLPRLLGPDFAPTVVDCQNPAVIGSGPTLLRYLSRELSKGLRRRRVAIEPLTAEALASEPFAAFDEWLDAVERAMPQGMRALLCLDEYERLQVTLDAGWGASFLDALRHTLQYRPRVVLMFVGAHTFQELGSAWTDRFISARRVRVSFLDRQDVEVLLTEPIPEFNMKYAPGTLDAIVAATNCQPFLTQAVAFELVQLLNEQQRKVATLEDIEVAITSALVSGSEYFANVWSDAGEQGQAILHALAYSQIPPDAPIARTWLVEHDVLNSAGGFSVEMVRRWVTRKSS